MGLLRRPFQFLVPSLLQGRAPWNELATNGHHQEPPRPTDFLDGIRGVAALSVMLLHYCARPYPRVAYGYGFRDNLSFWQLPFIRFIYSGATMVSIFFIISGFVLSAKSIKLMRSQSHSALLSTLSSTTFRRAVRLFLPTLAASFGCYALQRIGYIGRPHPGYVSSFVNDTAAYLDFLFHLYNVWTWERYHGFYSAQLWTIPVEFRCSMVVFLTLLALSRCRMRVRLGVEGIGTIICLVYSRWDMAPFFVGMALAELTIHSQEQQAQKGSLSIPAQPSRRNTASPRKLMAWTMLIFGVYLGSVPQRYPLSTPGYKWLSFLDLHDPNETFRYLSFYGATMIVSAILLLPSCQKVFTTPLARYSGKISYALYLTHGIINRSFGVRFQRHVWDILGKDSVVQYNLGFLIGFAVYAAVCICVADVFWRAVDIPSVNLARWIEDKSLAQPFRR